MKSVLTNFSRLQFFASLILVSIIAAIAVISLESLASILFWAPFLAFFIALVITQTLRAKGMLKVPWVFIPIAIWIKVFSWAGLAIYWPLMAEPECWWPFTGNVYYGFDVIGSMIILGFGSYLVSCDEQRFFRHGLIADSSLLFLVAVLTMLIFFYDVSIDYFETITLDNFLVRLQVLPFTYYFFVSIVVMLTLREKSGEGQVAYFLCIIPFSAHVYIEAYANYVAIPVDQQLLYARISACCYYLAAFTIFIYILFADSGDDTKKITRYGFGLSPLIWVASSITLIIPPTMIFVRQFFVTDEVSSPHNYLFIFIASIAIFIRFTMLIIQARQQQHMLNAEASRDELTDILNRRGFLKELEQNSAYTPGALFCLLDINNFKSINDTCGHHIGDQVLQYIANTLDSYPDIPLSARLGGDEFVMVLQVGDKKPEMALQVLHESLASWQKFDGKRIYVGVSIGASYLKPEIDFSLLYTSADYALYQAKNNYSGTVINQSELTATQINARLIPDLIQDALDTEQICLHFQPIYNLDDGKMSSIEVLMRLHDDDGRIYMPSQFLAMAIKHNKIMPLTRLLLNKLTEMSSQLPDVRVAINFPPAFFEDDIARQQIITELDKFESLKPRLSLEITEEYNSDVQVLRKAVSSLRKEGYCFALDDFGAGSASLARLAYLPVDIVKIDISLLRAAEQGNIAPLESVVALAKRLKSQVVVEGIETSHQLNIARRVRADMGQGYFFSRPVELSELLRLPRILPEFATGRLLAS